jgi:hypothetical protein
MPGSNTDVYVVGVSQGESLIHSHINNLVELVLRRSIFSVEGAEVNELLTT